MIFIPQVNSTNIYATQRISDGLSVHGEVVWTHHQTAGRGQRSKNWDDEQGKSVLMSMVLLENLRQLELFQLNAIVALAVRVVIKEYVTSQNVSIKWPNDIFINDKKACGILIENTFRGTSWFSAVIGIGVNVLQEGFPEALPHATSLLLETGEIADLETIIRQIQQRILQMMAQYLNDKESLWELYNQHLYKIGSETSFILNENELQIKAMVMGVDATGQLMLKVGAEVQSYQFGSLQWIL